MNAPSDATMLSADLQLQSLQTSAIAIDHGDVLAVQLRLQDFARQLLHSVDQLIGADGHDGARQASGLLIEQVSIALQSHLLRHYGERHRLQQTAGLARWQEQRAKELLSENLLTNVSIADVAADVQLSRSHFSKAFKQTTGCTPHRWLQEYKVGKARQLLQGEMSISDIAAACGFADQSHLTRVFAKIVGMPPSKWRRCCK